MAIEQEHSRLFGSIEEMSSSADIVVKVEIIEERHEIHSMGDSVLTEDEYSVYRMEVLQVYKGHARVGAVIEMLQFNRLQVEGRFSSAPDMHGFDIGHTQDDWPYRFSIDLIRLPLQEGEQLILFLNSQVGLSYTFLYATIRYGLGNTYFLANPIQAAFRYPSLESVNNYNNVSLTQDDLALLWQDNH